MQGIDSVVWDARGLVPVIVQDAGSGAVLALDAMDHQALVTTLATGWATYWVPTDGTMRGCAAGGPPQMVTAVHLACDGRAILLKVQPSGLLCRHNATGCFEAVLAAERVAPAAAERAVGPADTIVIQWLSEAAEGA
jgi:phosphoribosyl-AMP cyclohydrolase